MWAISRCGPGCARELVYSSPFPETLRAQIVEAYQALVDEYGPEVSVAVRSSATAEDLPTASFAGQHETSSTSSGGASC